MSDTIEFLALDYLDVTTDGTALFNGVATELVVTAKDGDEDTDTGYDVVNAAVIVQDDDKNTLTTNHGLVALTSGVGTVSDFTVTIPEGTTGPLNIYAELTETEDEVKGVTDRDYYPKGFVQKLYGIKTLVFTVEPTAVNRDTNFSMTIQAQDGNGNLMTDATDTITVTLNGADLFDVFTSPTPDAATFDVDLVSGEWSTTTEQITGGDGFEVNASISISADDFVSAETTGFYIKGIGTHSLMIIPRGPIGLAQYNSSAEAGVYSDGEPYRSVDGGETWSLGVGTDLYFKIYADETIIAETTSVNENNYYFGRDGDDADIVAIANTFTVSGTPNFDKVEFGIRNGLGATGGSGAGICDVYIRDNGMAGDIVASGSFTPSLGAYDSVKLNEITMTAV